MGAPERMKRASIDAPIAPRAEQHRICAARGEQLIGACASEGAVGGARKCTERERARAVGVYDMGKVGHARKHRSAGSLGIGLT